jgi:hypothetical protein
MIPRQLEELHAEAERLVRRMGEAGLHFLADPGFGYYAMDLAERIERRVARACVLFDKHPFHAANELETAEGTLLKLDHAVSEGLLPEDVQSLIGHLHDRVQAVLWGEMSRHLRSRTPPPDFEDFW